MQRTISTATVFAFVLTAGASATAEVNKPARDDRPKIEVVFVLDTTGSMGGLIEGAKQRIWDIANAMATAKPTPAIKMGLVGYRDRGDQYVTQRTDLTTDLDRVYTDLMAFQAAGGGDGPESVNQALHETVTLMQWSKESGVYRVIFLVGDFPPHMDYDNDVKYPESCKRAITNGIAINTIQCGGNADTEPIWQEIARKAEGRYFRVEQSGGAILMETPFDAELARLSTELDATRIFYGSRDVIVAQKARAEAADDIGRNSSVAAQAQRCAFNASDAGVGNFLGGQELVNDVKEGRVKLADVKDEELPESFRKLSPEQRKQFIDEQSRKRAELQKKIGALSTKRHAHIKDQMEKQGAKADSGFDHAMVTCIREQAGKKGIRLEK